MHIDEFVDRMKSDIEKFSEAYKRQHKEFPDQFPLSLEGYEEWIDMLEFVVNTEE